MSKEGAEKLIIQPAVVGRIPIAGLDFQMSVFLDPQNGREHVALTLGEVSKVDAPLLRIHSECLTGDVFGSQRCDCGPQLQGSLELIAEVGSGVLLYLRQEGRGIGLVEKLKAYALQDQGFDTVEANRELGHADDARDYSLVPKILEKLGVMKVRLITNNPDKIAACAMAGVEVVERIELSLAVSEHNRTYLKTKALKLGHLIKV